MKTKNKLTKAVAFASLWVMYSAQVYAGSAGGGTGMPWESGLDKVLNSLKGPVVGFFIFCAIIVSGLVLALGEHGRGAKMFVGVIFGGSIATGLAALYANLFGAIF